MKLVTVYREDEDGVVDGEFREEPSSAITVIRSELQINPGKYISTISELMKCSGFTVAVDTETTGLHPWNDQMIGLGFHCPQLNVEGYIPTHTDQERLEVRAAISCFADSTVFILQNAKFDLHFLRLRPKSNPNWTFVDTAIMVHLVDSRNRKSLEAAELKFLGSASKREHLDSAPARKKIWEWPEILRAAYCVNDCRVTYQLAQVLAPILEDLQLTNLFWKDMKVMGMIYDTEDYGVLMNERFVERASEKLLHSLKIMERNLMDSCGAQFNWRSPQQLSRAIYDGLGIAKPKNPFAGADGVDRSRFADAGKYKSTCTSTFLLTEKVHHPLGELISAMRECDKLRKAYLKWMDLQDSNHILHTSFNQTGTRTGRLSSSRPNLQNIASNTRGRFTQSVYTGSVKRTDEFNMRKAIIARPGCQFISVDYKQMEMRMFGILSQDPFMLSALLSGKDVHLEIALKVWGDCGDDMNKVHREWSKTITFGLIYGMTLGSLQFKLNMTKAQAGKVTDDYWKEFPRIKPWMNEIVQMCKRDNYLRYWSGRIWVEEDPLDMYKGCNALIQGGCFDLLSIAALKVDAYNDSVQGNHIINYVHDETITECLEENLLSSSRAISELMMVPELLGVPFATDVKVGPSYGVMGKLPKDILLDSSVNSVDINQLLSKDSEFTDDDEDFYVDDYEDEDTEES